MTEADAFLEAIIENPWDDSPRLVYADWLEERGKGDRAEFIRVQCELAACSICSSGQDGTPVLDFDCGHDTSALRRRERELWPGIGGAILWCGGGWADQLQPRFEWFRRGFVECVTCSAEDWLAQGRYAVLMYQPVLEVTLCRDGFQVTQIRSPGQSLIGFCEATLEEARRLASADNQSFLRNVIRSGRREKL